MSDNKKYYYLKIKENFFETEEMIILQGMPDGYLYSDILMKLYLRSLKNEGKLMYKDRIPYTPQVIAQVVRHQIGTVEKAIQIFQDLGLIEILDNGAIYITDIQNFIGESSTEADRKRLYREKIKQERICCTNVGQMSDKCPDKTPPELELELEIEKELDIDKEFAKITKSYEENIGMMTPAIKELIEYYIDKMETNMIIRAIKIASQKNARNAKYINAILSDWQGKGYKVESDIQEKPKSKNKAIKNTDEREYSNGELSKLYANI